MKFSHMNQPSNRGRKVGSRNKRTIISEDLHTEALAKLTEAVTAAEQWAIVEVLARTSPKLKPTAIGSEQDLLIAQVELTHLKAKEVSEFQERLEALEQASK